MPQPISHVFPDAAINLASSGGTPLDQRPKLAILAMSVIADWSTLEFFMRYLFGRNVRS